MAAETISFRMLDYKEWNSDMFGDDDKSSASGSGSASGGSDVDDSSKSKFKDNKEFSVQVFGKDEKGESYCLFVREVYPFFFVKVGDDWKKSTKELFLDFLVDKVGAYYKDSILECKLIKKKNLYGFDAGKLHKFVYLRFKNIQTFKKVKSLYFTYTDGARAMNNVEFHGCVTRIYESNIPPLLKFFHRQDLSPSGWVSVPRKYLRRLPKKMTTCDHEYQVSKRHITPLPDKNTLVPINICSFDIEASSSHGDFPLPVKNYKKLADNIIEYWDNKEIASEIEDRDEQEIILGDLIKDAFLGPKYDFIQKVYPKKELSETQLDQLIKCCIAKPMSEIKVKTGAGDGQKKIYDFGFEEMENGAGGDEGETGGDEGIRQSADYRKFKTYLKKQTKMVDLLNDSTFPREDKLNEMVKTFDSLFPELKGDKVTFIGSTFWRVGDKKPYLEHCAVLGDCNAIPNVEVQTTATERDLLLAWKDVIHRENPDIIIGYNTFSFDYTFMFERAKDLGILKEFLKLSRNRGEICGEHNYKTGEYTLNTQTLMVASGTHELRFIEMPGRINIDLYNYFRREYNLESYKLDYVSGYFIGDKFKKFVCEPSTNTTTIYTKNLTGINKGNFVTFEEKKNSAEMYNDGEKFQVIAVDYTSKTITIQGQPALNQEKKLKWCIAKDDVSPQDIFRLTKTGDPADKAIVAKYCVQDCNLVHHLLNKMDVVTGYIEMATICSVPINFLIMRGQGIKLISFLSKIAGKEDTLIPDLDKRKGDEGYEGAIVLPPKCGIYLDEPVACVDYSSLYPSSMISENLSHDSKVWTKEYNLAGELVKEEGDHAYDNYPGYKYVDVTFDTYRYIPNERGKPKKTKVGYKICRFAQFPEGKKALLPAILEKLLAARKWTRKLEFFKTVKFADGTSISGLLSNDKTSIMDKDKVKHFIDPATIVSEEDTYDDFMKNIFDKRQLGYKVTANSMYGQTGAKTSDFYEPDVAAATTATGRMLLTYGKRVIEEIYSDNVCQTSQGPVRTNAEYVYGDTDSVFLKFNLKEMDGTTPIKGKRALELTIELGKQVGGLASKFLKPPHDWEYEKTFEPFCLLSKKRYVGMLYEDDPNECDLKSMGIVLKRRDNAPIVKDIYGGIIDILMNDRDVEKSIEFTKTMLMNLIGGKIPMSKLVITKSLRGYYANPKSIAHKVLADRMGLRDPGNKPGAGDRIPFVYIETKTKSKMQGDKIEHPKFIEQNKLKPDLGFYVTNQIMKPVQQVFALVLEKIPSFQKRLKTFKMKLAAIYAEVDDPEKLEEKEMKLRNKEVEDLIFGDVLREITNRRNKNGNIMKLFGLK